MAKGKRKVVFEFNGGQYTNTDIEKKVYDILKRSHGVKYSNNIDMYINQDKNSVYCVVDGNTTVIALDSI